MRLFEIAHKMEETYISCCGKVCTNGRISRVIKYIYTLTLFKRFKLTSTMSICTKYYMHIIHSSMKLKLSFRLQILLKLKWRQESAIIFNLIYVHCGNYQLTTIHCAMRAVTSVGWLWNHSRNGIRRVWCTLINHHALGRFKKPY